MGESTKHGLPDVVEQNPAPTRLEGQAYLDAVASQTQKVLEAFRKVLPSNYVSQVNGPWYTLQFQALAEEIARIQVEAQQVFLDTDFDYTRSEFLWQVIGLLVFPDSNKRQGDIPTIDGDVSYRDFLKNMVVLLLKGATKEAVEQGIQLLTEADVQVIEKVAHAQETGTAWGLDDQFTFEVNVEKDGGTDWPSDPFTLKKNVELVLRVLKPAHTLYEYRHLFRETFGSILSGSYTLDMEDRRYEDLRKYPYGAKSITGTGGTVLSDRTLFSDPTRDFTSVRENATLTILEGENKGVYQVASVLVFPVGDDPTPRPYTTAPTGLSGEATVVGDTLVDPNQDWSQAARGEVLTLLEGPNAGSYRLKAVLGAGGGPVGEASGPGSAVQAAPSLLRLRSRLPVVAGQQAYEVTVDRLGRLVPIPVVGEDASPQFYSEVANQSSTSTKAVLTTKRGPLVKGWGDGTPASPDDVVVRVNGTPVTVVDVNPYTGEVTIDPPIQLAPAGGISVEVDYTWFPAPIVPLERLNHPGLTLNQWALSRGRNTTSTSTWTGAHREGRFPMSVVLGPARRFSPRAIGYRYLGFEQSQSALLNSPTLLLNRDPHRAGLLDISRIPAGVSVAFSGASSPVDSDSPWSLRGVDQGQVGDDGWILVDQDGEDGVVYTREEDTSFPCLVSSAVRLQVTSYTPSGVFSGVGFGFHDNRRLYLVGLLDINGIKHVGLLQDGSNPTASTSWIIGLGVSLAILDEETCSADTASLPVGLSVGDRFQILDGLQVGVYTIESLVHQSDGTTTITILETFPADPKLWGGNTATAYLEIRWDEALIAYRMMIASSGDVEVHASGHLSGLALALAGEDLLAYPAQVGWAVPTGNKSLFFFGSLSKDAQSTSTWAFHQYGILPDAASYHSRGVVVSADMDVEPENAPDEWFITGQFGYSTLTTGSLLLKATSGGYGPFGYARVEPFLVADAYLDLDARFSVDSGTSPGDATILVEDGVRRVEVGTLLYVEGTESRSLLTLGSISLSGLDVPGDVGWEAGSDLAIEATASDSGLVIRQEVGQEGIWYADLSDPKVGSRTIEARVTVLEHTPNTSGDVGLVWGAEAGTLPNAKLVAVSLLANPSRVMLHSDGNPVASFSFEWDDGSAHTYRVLVDEATDSVSLVVDDTVLGVAALSAFDPASTNTMGFIGAYGTDTAFSARIHAFSVAEVPPSYAKRTLGVFTGSDKSNIDHWVLPRNDGEPVPNSSPSADVVEMDWRDPVWVRIHRDPTWGVSILRPDLPPPPGYDGDFATEATEPSAAWINVEYANLPRTTKVLGEVSWGALNPESISQQRWTQVRYRVYRHPTKDLLVPHHMVLNRAHTVHSGELGRDTTIETVVVESATSKTVSLLPAHIFADRVFTVMVGDTVLASSQWAFDQATQTITFEEDLGADHVPVTVSFAPGKPVTTTWLQAQPAYQSTIQLNEGTPPHVKDLVGDPSTGTFTASDVTDSTSPLSDPGFAADDPARFTSLDAAPGTVFEDLDLFEVDDGGEPGLPLSMLFDGPAPGEGLGEIHYEGTVFTEQQVKGDAPLRDGTGPYPHASLFHASGGGYVGGTLAPGTMVLWPNAMHENQPVQGATRKRFWSTFSFQSVLTDSTDPGSETSLEDNLLVGTDNNPPADVDGGVGTPSGSGLGTAVYRIEDGGGLYSRLGPWGPGSVALSAESLIAGGSPLGGSEFTLLGGSPVGSPSTTSGMIASE